MSKCLMLDVDGVLINGRDGYGQSWSASLKDDLGIAPERLQECFFQPHWPDVVTGRKGLIDALDLCLRHLSDTVTAECLLQYWFRNDACIDETILTDCRILRNNGMLVFLATNQEHLRARYIMENLGIRDHVDGMVYSAGLGARKPDAAFFEAAVAACGFPASDITLIDDTAANVEAALAAGWDARRWTGEKTLRELLAFDAL